MTDDKIKQHQDPVPENTETEESLASQIAKLEGQVAQQNEELTQANSHITELEQRLTESTEKLKTADNSLGEALVNYRTMVMQTNPEVPAELITGDSIPAINESLRQAKGMISQVRQSLETEIQATRIPAGAPPRTPLDHSSLSPRQKIRYAIGGDK
ncbi:MAG: hypothetical protein J7K77_04735 [Dehalococcoidales bacterium]|nr:hypothetical protein [Dehalococcoidales bacterium]